MQEEGIPGDCADADARGRTMQTQGLPAAAALMAGDQAVAAAEGPPLKTARAPLSGECACPTSPAASPAARPPGCPPPVDATAAPLRCAPCPASLGTSAFKMMIARASANKRLQNGSDSRCGRHCQM